MMSPSVDQSLQQALSEFESTLDKDQTRELHQIATRPDVFSVIKLTTELDEKNSERRTHSVGTRLSKILKSVQEFACVVDQFVSSNPRIAGLVWGSVKFTMLVSCYLDACQCTRVLTYPGRIEFLVLF